MMAPQSLPLPALKTLLWRGWCKKCPQCGQGRLYVRWLKLHEHCPACGVQYLPNQGDLLGPLFFLDRVLFLVPFIALFYFRLWHPSMLLFLLVGALMIFALVFTMPNRNGVSLAFDYYLRRKSDAAAEKESAK